MPKKTKIQREAEAARSRNLREARAELARRLPESASEIRSGSWDGGAGMAAVLKDIETAKAGRAKHPPKTPSPAIEASACVDAASQAVADAADLPVGDYVYDPPYLEMRLRMALTGTAAPSKEVWSSALRKLLDHLAENPIDREEDKPTILVRLIEAMRGMDLERDLIPLARTSMTGLEDEMAGRTMDGCTLLLSGITRLGIDSEGLETICVNAKMNFADDPIDGSIRVSLIGKDTGEGFDWRTMDRPIDGRSRAHELVAVRMLRMESRMDRKTLRDADCNEVVALIESRMKGSTRTIAGENNYVDFVFTVDIEKLVSYGDGDNHRFSAPCRIGFGCGADSDSLECIVQGRVNAEHEIDVTAFIPA
jgi:hypothetical protein